MKILIFILAVCLAGCVSLRGTSYRYEYEMLNDNVDSAEMAFEDSIIQAQFDIGRSSINFFMRNKTAAAIKILWDEASFIIGGQSQKIMHSGVKYASRGDHQPPTVIPPNATISDNAIPTENIYYQEPYYGTYVSSPGGWREADLFPSHITGDTARGVYRLVGVEFALYLPLQLQDKTREYTFNFKIKNIRAKLN